MTCLTSVNNPIFKSTCLATLAFIALSFSATAVAWPDYIAETLARGCNSCHLSEFGRPRWWPGVLEAFDRHGIQGLKNFLATNQSHTKPVVHPLNRQWDVTVGEWPLVIPLRVSDQENDTFALRGLAPAGYSVSPVYRKNNLPTLDLIWSPTAAQGNKTYTLRLYVQETGIANPLQSNTVTAKVRVWPARTSKTRNVRLFMLHSARWQSNTLTLRGQLRLKDGLTATEQAAVLAGLTMKLTSAKGVNVSRPVRLAPRNGTWQKRLTLNAETVPCRIRVDYESLKAERVVTLAPAVTCVH